MGRREQKKAETTRRIALAGRLLFRRQGYEPTTTQEIAIEAGIPPGTLFGYITTKADILIIALLDEALEFVAAIPARIPRKASPIDQIAFIYTQMQAYHSTDAELFRHFMRELSVTTNKTMSPNANTLGNALRDIVTAVIVKHQAAGRLTSTIPASKMSYFFFAHYWQCIRFWTMGYLPQERFGADLREALTWQIEGLAPKPEESASSSTAKL